MGNLDNHIGRVTAKWKEQGVYIAVTNVAGGFEYGVDENVLRQVFLTEIHEKAKKFPAAHEEPLRTAAPADQHDPTPLSIPEFELSKKLKDLKKDSTFLAAISFTNDTFALVLRRIGDKNVLPHVHIMLSYLTSFAANNHVSYLLADIPWAELVAFLNTLVKIENQVHSQNQTQAQDIDTLLMTDVFPSVGERVDELPLPEDYLVRGLIWAHDYFPDKWFERQQDEEARYMEFESTVRCRMERVLRLGFQLTKVPP
ncbi:hypothetical protein NX059_012186 [Plenodomus lindquistii]|nr:hypothetical protein NX059_012186 [Plenodomus lindquistii]